MKNLIYAFGLSREEIHTLEILLPISFQVIRCDPKNDFDEEYAIEKIVRDTMCIVINPKMLISGQLQVLLEEQELASHCRHVPMLLFTESPTREQLKFEVHNRDIIRRINLHARMDCNRSDAVEILCNAAKPSWMGLNDMKSNMFNDGWYLIDLETTGTDPLRDDIIAVRIAYMANYEIKCEHVFHIKPKKPITSDLEITTGITSEMLSDGKMLEAVIEELNHLKYNAPLVFFNESFTKAFLDVAWHLCGQSFDKTYLVLDGLAAIVFGYNLYRKPQDILGLIKSRKIHRTPVVEPNLAELYDITLAIFEETQDRYDVRAPGDFGKLYGSDIYN